MTGAERKQALSTFSGDQIKALEAYFKATASPDMLFMGLENKLDNLEFEFGKAKGAIELARGLLRAIDVAKEKTKGD